MSKPDLKTALAAYKSYKNMPSSGDTAQDLRTLARLFRRVKEAAQNERIELKAEHLS